MKEAYLGDGAYVKDMGFEVEIYTDRLKEGRHWVALEPDAFSELCKFVAKVWKVKITVEGRGVTTEITDEGVKNC